MLAYYMLRRATRLITNLEVDGAQMLKNLHSNHGVVFSQSVLLALVSTGMSRDDAYRLVQELASRAVAESLQFRELLAGDKRIGLKSKQLDEIFDLKKSVKHTNRVFEALSSKQS